MAKGKKVSLKTKITLIVTFIVFYIMYISTYIMMLNLIGGKIGSYAIKTLKYKLLLGDLSLMLLPKVRFDGEYMDFVQIPYIQNVILVDMLMLLIYFTITMLVLYKILKGKKKLTIHGSARWGTQEDLDYTSDATKPFETSLINDEGVVLGRFNGITLRDNAKTHILVSAPTRTGKGVSLIIPTLIDTWNESVVVLDIKGENYQKTSGARKNLFNNRIIRFAPKSKHSSRFNPMSEIRFLTEYEYEDIKLICKMLCQGDSDNKNKDSYWDDKAADLLAGVMTYELYKRFLENPQFVEDKNGDKIPISSANLTQVLDFFRDPSYTSPVKDVLGIKAKEDIFQYAKDKETADYVRKKLLELHRADSNMVLSGMHPNVSKTFVDFTNTADQTFGSILSNATDKLNIFGIDVVKRNTSCSDFRINDIMNYEKPVSLYLVVEPSAIVLMAPLIRILLVQMINLLTPEMDYNDSSKNHKHRCLLLLDEFPAIGKMDVLEKGIGYVAGYGMKVMIILQSLDQLYKIYGKENMFLSNCQVQVFYTANDVSTAEYVSKSLGKETIENYTQGRGGGMKLHAQQQQFLGRDLLTIDEVRTFPLDKILLLVAGKPPFKVDKIRYFQEKLYLDRSNIPYVYSESCYDKTLQYYENTTDKYKDIKYIPYRSALKGLIDLHGENKERISKMSVSDPSYKNSLESYKINGEKLKKYVELLNILAPEMKKDIEIKNKLLEKLKESKLKGSFKSYSDVILTNDLDLSDINKDSLINENEKLKTRVDITNVNLSGIDIIPKDENDDDNNGSSNELLDALNG